LGQESLQALVAVVPGIFANNAGLVYLTAVLAKGAGVQFAVGIVLATCMDVCFGVVSRLKTKVDFVKRMIQWVVDLRGTILFLLGAVVSVLIVKYKTKRVHHLDFDDENLDQGLNRAIERRRKKEEAEKLSQFFWLFSAWVSGTVVMLLGKKYVYEIDTALLRIMSMIEDIPSLLRELFAYCKGERSVISTVCNEAVATLSRNRQGSETRVIENGLYTRLNAYSVFRTCFLIRREGCALRKRAIEWMATKVRSDLEEEREHQSKQAIVIVSALGAVAMAVVGIVWIYLKREPDRLHEMKLTAAQFESFKTKRKGQKHIGSDDDFEALLDWIDEEGYSGVKLGGKKGKGRFATFEAEGEVIRVNEDKQSVMRDVFGDISLTSLGPKVTHPVAEGPKYVPGKGFASRHHETGKQSQGAEPLVIPDSIDPTTVKIVKISDTLQVGMGKKKSRSLRKAKQVRMMQQEEVAAAGETPQREEGEVTEAEIRECEKEISASEVLASRSHEMSPVDHLNPSALALIRRENVLIMSEGQNIGNGFRIPTGFAIPGHCMVGKYTAMCGVIREDFEVDEYTPLIGNSDDSKDNLFMIDSQKICVKNSRVLDAREAVIGEYVYVAGHSGGVPFIEHGRVKGFGATGGGFFHDALTMAGDSGSLVVSRKDNRVVGYHNAGSVHWQEAMPIPDFRDGPV